MGKASRFKVIVSDCHLSAGRLFEGRLNPHEDFRFDGEMRDLIRHYSTGRYGTAEDGAPVEVELILAGDFLDFLNVPYHGEFEDEVTEEMAVYKAEAILRGHPMVWEAFRAFAALPGKTITYLIGNHDADLAFAAVRATLIRVWDPEGRFPSPVVRILHDTDRLHYPEGVEVRHGQQLDPGNDLDFARPTFRARKGRSILNLPWSSIYVLKIINPMKWEREWIDKVRPAKAFILFGMLLDPVFMFRFLVFSTTFFLRTRLSARGRARYSVRQFMTNFRAEARFFRNLEDEARQILDESPGVRTVIFGHTHYPMDKVYPDGKQYINTGTWTRMINMDIASWGQGIRRTFALVELMENGSRAELRQWNGESGPHSPFSA
ncbi:MAG: metallophosphoesterase [Bdellovibrionales bacterium]|nr:metallophosphoesterase [Bdellovibrionales bacterium]